MAAIQWSADPARGSILQAPVVALHGWMDQASSFERLAAELGGVGNILAPDFPGHGLSEHLPDGCSYHFLDHLHDIDAAVVAAAGSGEPVHLVGHSMGGALAVLYAAAFPETILSVVSIDALGPMSDGESNTANRLRQGVLARRSQSAEARTFDSRADAIAARASAGDAGEEVAKALAERGLVEGEDGWYWNGDRRLRAPSIVRLTEAQVLSALSRVRCPTLLIEAAQSPFKYPGDLAEKRAAALNHGKRVVVPAGHHAHIDSAAECAQHVTDFYDEHGFFSS